MISEGRFRVVEKTDPERFRRLLDLSQREARQRYAIYQQLAGVTIPREEGSLGAAGAAATGQATPEEVAVAGRKAP